MCLAAKLSTCSHGLNSDLQVLIGHCQMWIARLLGSLNSVTSREIQLLAQLLQARCDKPKPGKEDPPNDALQSVPAGSAAMKADLMEWEARLAGLRESALALTTHKVIHTTSLLGSYRSAALQRR